jgi:hypothetical protein
MADLYDYHTETRLRPATDDEVRQSKDSRDLIDLAIAHGGKVPNDRPGVGPFSSTSSDYRGNMVYTVEVGDAV